MLAALAQAKNPNIYLHTHIHTYVHIYIKKQGKIRICCEKNTKSIKMKKKKSLDKLKTFLALDEENSKVSRNSLRINREQTDSNQASEPSLNLLVRPIPGPSKPTKRRRMKSVQNLRDNLATNNEEGDDEESNVQNKKIRTDSETNQDDQPEPLPGPSRSRKRASDHLQENREKVSSSKRPRTKTDEEDLSIKPSKLEQDIDSVDSEIKSFRKKITILDTNEIKIVLKKVAFKRQNKFKFSDHLFEVFFVPKTSGKSPYMLDLLDFFRKVIVKIILMLKNYYNKALKNSDKKDLVKIHRQIYGTVLTEHMIRGMNTANFSIQTNPHIIAFELTNRLFRFLQSWEHMRLDKKFCIYFKVLSTSHANYRVWKKKNLSLHVPVGAKVVGFKANPNSKSVWKFCSPEGYPSNEKAFHQRCLLVSVILGYIYNKWLESPTSIEGREWEIVKHIHHSDIQKRKAAGEILHGKVSKALQETKLSSNTSLDYIETSLPILSEYYHAQVIVHSERAGNRISCVYPPKFDDKLCQIHLYQSANWNAGFDHVDLILNRKTLLQTQGMVHNCCFLFSRGPQIGHLCKARESCLCCRRPIRKLNSYVNEEIKETTCDTWLVPAVFEKCSVCGLMKKSAECAKYHNKYCCKKGYLCANCCKFIRKVLCLTDYFEMIHFIDNFNPLSAYFSYRHEFLI